MYSMASFYFNEQYLQSYETIFISWNSMTQYPKDLLEITYPPQFTCALHSSKQWKSIGFFYCCAILSPKG